MEYFVYILRSHVDQNHYVGITKDPEKRLVEHNAGKTPSTKHRRPFELVYKESFASRIEAREREKYLKSYRGSKEKMKILGSL